MSTCKQLFSRLEKSRHGAERRFLSVLAPNSDALPLVAPLLLVALPLLLLISLLVASLGLSTWHDAFPHHSPAPDSVRSGHTTSGWTPRLQVSPSLTCLTRRLFSHNMRMHCKT